MKIVEERANENPRILFLSLHSNEQHYLDHLEAQLKTWPGEIEDLFWLRGDDRATEVSVKGDYIDCPVSEEFGNILGKRIMGLRFAITKWDYDYYVLINTSTYINIPALKRYIGNEGPHKKTASAAKGRHVSKDTGLDENFLAGNLIILPKQAAKSLAAMQPDRFDGIADDIAISRYLEHAGYHLNFLGRNDLTDFKPFKFALQHRVKSWEDPKITTARFHELSAIYTDTRLRSSRSYFSHSVQEFRRYIRSYPINRGLNILRVARYTALVLKNIIPNLTRILTGNL